MLSVGAYDRAILHPQMRKLMQGDFYNVGLWQDPEDTPNVASARLVHRLLEADTDKSTPSAVLDVGCGLGVGSDLIASAYPHAQVHGVNYSSQQVEKAAGSYPRRNLSFVCADAIALPFPDNSVDRIFCVEAAMHFRTRADFLAEAGRVLRPGGRLFMADILCTKANSVIPPENIVADIARYGQLCAKAGFMDMAHSDVTDQSVVPFCAYLRRVGQGPIARFFEDMVHAYVLVDMSTPYTPAEG